MVLRLICVALCAACVHRAPPQRLGEPARVAVAMLVDAEGVASVPVEVQQRVGHELSLRNLEPRPLDDLGATRNTQQRLAQLARAGESPFLLLIETRVVYYDLLQGRYRWVVYARESVARRDDIGAAATTEFEIPVFLSYDHEKEPEALKAAAGTLADRTGALLDGFLAVPPPKTGALYFILIDRFANGDKANDGAVDAGDPQAFHGGDLQGVLDRLDELQALGVSALWLSPLFRMRTEKFFGYGAFHGYWTEDLTQVEPRFGDEALLRKLSAELHRRGMKLFLDLVLNHVAPEGRLFRGHPDWFHREGSISDWNDPRQMETRDVSGLPDLAQEKPEVYAYLLNASLKWMPLADGYRLDAVKHISAEFWRRFNGELHSQRPAFTLLGEALDGDPAKLGRLQRNAGFDGLFDFPLAFALNDVFCKDKPAGRIGAILSLDRLYADAQRLVTLLDDHDLPRVTEQCGGDLERVKQALLAQILSRGTPMISYGTEAALRDPRGDDVRAPQPLREWVRDLLALRAKHGALQYGAESVVALDEMIVLARSAGNETIAVALNRGPQPRELKGELLFGALPVPPHGSAVVRIAPLPPAGIRELSFTGTAALGAGDVLAVAGAGPEFGGWDPALAPALPATVRLAGRSVAEIKLIVRRSDGKVEWEKGEDRFILVEPGDGPQRVEMNWRS